MRTIERNVYTFDELSEEVREKVINNLSDINVDFDWWSHIYEDAKSVGIQISSFDLDRNRHAKGCFLLSAAEVAQNILNSHGEKCETYKTTQQFLHDWQPVFDNYMDETHRDYESNESEDKLMELEDEFLSSLLEDYANMLQEECDFLEGREAIVETIKANEYEFYEDGTMF